MSTNETARSTRNRAGSPDPCSSLARDLLSQLAAAKAALLSGDREAGVQHLNIAIAYVDDVDALASTLPVGRY
jgi:CO dehydrogenase nickel-insertion accessory protein CooC1